jgi:hypothetical protein
VRTNFIMKISAAIFIILIFSTSSFAQDFTQTVDAFVEETLAYITTLGDEFEIRFGQYVASYEKLSEQFKNLTNIPDLDRSSKFVCDNIVTQVDNVITGYRAAIDKQIFVDETTQLTNFVRESINNESLALRNKFSSIASCLPTLSQCFTNNSQQVLDLVLGGIKSAKDAATAVITSANTTLNTNQATVESTIGFYQYLISLCNTETPQSCVKSVLDLAGTSIPGNLASWFSSTGNVLYANLDAAEASARSALNNVKFRIGQIVTTLQTCATNIFVQEMF